VDSVLPYILSGIAGLIVASLLTRAPELRPLRLVQLVLVPLGFIAASAVMPEPSSGQVGAMGSLVAFSVILGFLAILLAPNIAHLFGVAFSGLLDPQDWTPAEEEIALRPVVRLIEKDRFSEALTELDELLKKHKPTYEALHIRAKLLNHFRRFDEASATLLQMIRLSYSTGQQLIVMELLATLDSSQSRSKGPFVPGVRRMPISHELVLFRTDSDEQFDHKEIQAGDYQVEPIIKGGHTWLVLIGEPWGNAESCWEAVREIAESNQASARKGFLYRVASLQQSIVVGKKRKSHRQSKAESIALHKEAKQLIRQGDWAKAMPLLEKASVEDPDNYEIAYRLVQAAYQVGARSNPAAILRKVLAQSRWTEDQERMLQQLRP
jgi:tetratricopeptide (TPR) repeat protein